MKKYIKIMRIDHWIKQFFILPGFACSLFLSGTSLNLKIFFDLLIALFATSLIASANYVINEYLDASYDKVHPVKKARPLVEENVKGSIIFVIWLVLGISGLLLGYFKLGRNFMFMEIILLLMGILYNVKPFRLKDIFLLDVLSESVNNVIRFMLGWFVLPITIVVPISIVFGYWMGGAFLMAIKRYAEYRMIGNKKVAAAYRKSFKYYNEKILLVTSFFYAMCSTFFIGVFLIKYRIELILFIPFMIGLFCFYFYISFDKDSAVQKPEKLYKEKGLMLYSMFLVILFMVLMNVRIPWLDIFTK